jgi:catechol 2,3-dioxygenase
MIDARAEIGEVRLTVNDLDRSRQFYEEVLGMRAAEQDDGSLALGVAGAAPLLRLRGDSGAPRRDPRLTGLFHFALLLPTRRDLAGALLRLARRGWSLTGASDHLVSEALYLDDPDGNGIEIYRDRPREQWKRDGDGQLQMATLPLDLEDLVGALLGQLPAEGAEPELPAGSRIGHVHLQVAELREIEDFYSAVLGFEVMVRGYPGALFVAAGGYHHHIGLNTWNSRGAAAPPPGSVGLRCFEVRLPDQAALAEVLERVEAAELEVEPAGDGAQLRDPSGNGVLLSVQVP